jgi:hypothetical protein
MIETLAEARDNGWRITVNHMSQSNIAEPCPRSVRFVREGEIAMAAFERANEPRRNDVLGIPAKSHTTAWVAGIVVVAAIIIGAFVYESRGTHESVTPAPTHEMTQPPPVNPAPPPEPAKPQ